MEKQKKEWVKPELNQIDINSKTNADIASFTDAFGGGSSS